MRSPSRGAPFATLREIFLQAFLTVRRRPVRSVLTAIGVALGVAVLVATTGMAATLNSAVNASFDLLQATRLVVEDKREITRDPLFDASTIDAELASLTNVSSGGLLTMVGEVAVSTSSASESIPLGIVAATPGGMDASGAQIERGRMYDDLAGSLETPQVVVGPGAAESLGLGTAGVGGGLVVNGVPVAITGILVDHGSEPQLGRALVIHPALLESIGIELGHNRTAVVRVELGAARTVADAIPFAIRPHDPDAVGVSYPPSIGGIRDDVQSSLDTMAIGGASLAILIGGIGIMNAMITAVNERTGEIGLRRALGARPRHIVVHILIEGCLLGFLGAVIGVILGVGILIGIAAVNDWTPVLPEWAWYLPVLGGTVVGAIAGIYPAIHSALLTPAAALRR